MTLFEFTLGVLAVWRVTHLLVAEDGPWGMIVWLRRKAGAGFWGTLLDCFYCLSLWVSAPFALLWGESWPQRVLVWLAVSAAAILLNRVADRLAPDQPVSFEEPETKIQEKERT